MAFLDDNGLLYFWQRVKVLLSNKVDAESGKGLSTEDFTTEEKTKLSGVSVGADANVIEAITVNGVAQAITSKSVNISVPLNNNQLTNGAGYQTAAQVQALIAASGHITRTIIGKLPTTGDANTIYMVSKNGSTDDVYNEYMYINNAWELIGSSGADLSGYVKETDTIDNAEIDTILAS